MSDSDTNTSTQATKFSKKLIPPRTLIALVKERRCLWDRICPGYRDKATKDEAWHEIYLHLQPDYDTLSQAQKNFIGSTITRKWHNARDSYVKSRKPGFRHKPYLYSKDLKFLDETFMHRKTRHESNFSEEEDNATEQDGTQTWMREVFVDIENSTTDNGIPAKRPKIEFEETFSDSPKTETPKGECEDNIVSVLVNLIQKEEDEDRAFFKSITPAVKRLSESSKFEFRIQVMKLINNLKIRDKKGTVIKRNREEVERDSQINEDSDSE